jgi:NAD kinase
MSTLQPRVVIVTRETDYEQLLAVHATRSQANFFVQSRGQDMEALAARHLAFGEAVHRVRDAIPEDWRIAKVQRGDLDRFLFSPEDLVLAVGQDGLVANLAKYLRGQPVLGINSAPEVNEGVLVPLRVEEVRGLLPAVAAGRAPLQRRTMARATLDGGQNLQALNEIFIGHRSHQSARYIIEVGGERERQSSSGVIVSTGTGATGWARSIMTATGHTVPFSPVDRALAFFVREPWPSVATGATINWGELDGDAPVRIVSQMNEGGVIFADGIEQDHLNFGWGTTVEVAVSSQTLNLVGRI